MIYSLWLGFCFLSGVGTHILSPPLHQYDGHSPPGRFHISPKTCSSPSGETGTCMFNFECYQKKGQVVTTCIDGFLFGACCKIPHNSSSVAVTLIPTSSRPQEGLSSNNNKIPPTNAIITTNRWTSVARPTLPSFVENTPLRTTTRRTTTIQPGGGMVDTLVTTPYPTLSTFVFVSGEDQVTSTPTVSATDDITVTTEDSLESSTNSIWNLIAQLASPLPISDWESERPNPSFAPQDHDDNTFFFSRPTTLPPERATTTVPTTTAPSKVTAWAHSTYAIHTFKYPSTTTPTITTTPKPTTRSTTTRPTTTAPSPSLLTTTSFLPPLGLTTWSTVDSGLSTWNSIKDDWKPDFKPPHGVTKPTFGSSTIFVPVSIHNPVSSTSHMTTPSSTSWKPSIVTKRPLPSDLEDHVDTLANQVVENLSASLNVTVTKVNYTTSVTIPTTLSLAIKPLLTAKPSTIITGPSTTTRRPTPTITGKPLTTWRTTRRPPTTTASIATKKPTKATTTTVSITTKRPTKATTTTYKPTTTNKRPIIRHPSTNGRPIATKRPNATSTWSTLHPQVNTHKRNITTTSRPILKTTTKRTATVKTTTTTARPVRPWDYKRECGVRPMVKNGRIVGGQPSSFGQWPWQALVRESTWLGLFTKNKCGGVLISNRYVLTAAHCQPGFLASLVVVFGEFDLSSDTEPRPVLQRNVRRVIVHRDYNAHTFENDVALLELETTVDFQPHVVPICMPYDEEDFTGKSAIVSGWGRLKYAGGVPSVLYEVDVPILKNEQCQQMFLTAGHVKAIRESFLCAGYVNGQKDSCEGDSGGPLMIPREDGRWVLAGTVSHGIKCAYPNMPGVYMRMTYYKPWIRKVTGIH